MLRMDYWEKGIEKGRLDNDDIINMQVKDDDCSDQSK